MLSTLIHFVWTSTWYIIWCLGLLFGIISLGTMFVMQLYQRILMMLPLQNFKTKYGCWAVVTGASSGIGLCITEILAEQGVNVVMVALDDNMLKEAHAKLSAKYPALHFRPCGVNLGSTAPQDYMTPIKEATRDIDVRILFNNAAFILFNFFADNEISKLRSNMNCNAICHIEITHHFARQMMSTASSKKNTSSAGNAASAAPAGFIGFTSSAGQYLPSPTAMLYSSTKCMISNFASSLQAEVRDVGIDVLAVHPGPVATGFYAHAAGLPTIEATQKLACGARSVAETFFAGAGRILFMDISLMTMGFKMATKVFDMAFLYEVFSRIAQYFPDHKILVGKSKLRSGKKN